MERECAFLCVLMGCVDAIICACLWLWEEEEKEREEEKVKEWQRERDRQRRSGWRIVAWCAALQRDNRMPARLAYLCCTPHSCFCCLPLPAKSHPAATWGRRSTPPGPCSSSSGRGQITNTNHLLILVIKETLITSELRSSAALNDHKEAISETIQRATQVQHNPFFSLFFPTLLRKCEIRAVFMSVCVCASWPTDKCSAWCDGKWVQEPAPYLFHPGFNPEIQNQIH